MLFCKIKSKEQSKYFFRSTCSFISRIKRKLWHLLKVSSSCFLVKSWWSSIWCWGLPGTFQWRIFKGDFQAKSNNKFINISRNFPHSTKSYMQIILPIFKARKVWDQFDLYIDWNEISSFLSIFSSKIWSTIKGSSDVSTTMRFFISLPNFKLLCVLLIF